MTPHRLVQVGLLEESARLLEEYAKVSHEYVPAGDLELWTYVPSIDDTATRLRECLASPPAVGSGAVAWMVVTPRGNVSTTYYTPPTAGQIAVAAHDGETIIPLYTHPTPPPAWMDIATAPRDGSHVLVLCKGRIWEAYWSDLSAAFMATGVGGLTFPEATHWMECPGVGEPASFRGETSSAVVWMSIETAPLNGTWFLAYYAAKGDWPAEVMTVHGVVNDRKQVAWATPSGAVTQPDAWMPMLALVESDPLPDLADMFWSDADPETNFDSIHTLLVYGEYQIGNEVEIRRAARLSNIHVRVIPLEPDGEDAGIDFEVIEDPST